MIAEDHLTKILLSPRADAETWYKKRIIMAAGLVARAGVRYAVEPEEVVGETISRVLTQHNRRYLWDGEKPDTFNKFFTRCMNTTTSYFASKGRGQIRGLKKLEAQVIFPTSYEAYQEAALEAECKSRSLATAIIKETRMRGATVKYFGNLHHYVEIGASTKEIAEDLSIKSGSVATIRKRLLARFGDDVEKG
ncbi:MAG: hypothetical protein V4517_08455 [Pseudomonadota bacterium]